MAGEFQNLGYALKVVYPNKALEAVINEEAPFREKLNASVPAGARVTEGSVKYNGVLALPQNVAQIVDGGALQDAAERSEVQFTLGPTIFQATMNIGWLTRKAANTGTSAWNGGEVRRRTEETASNLGKFIESTYVGTTGTGVRAYVESASASGIVCAVPEGVRLLRQGMKISVRQAADSTTHETALDAVRIASVNTSTRTITTTGTDTNANTANDTIYVVPGEDFTLTSVYANGLRGLVDDGTNSTYIHGVDRTAVGKEKLKSIVSSSTTNRDLTEALLIRTINEIRDNSGKRITDIWTSPGQIEKYIAFVAPDRIRMVSGGTYDKSTGWKEGELTHYAPGVAAKINFSFDMIPREMYLLAWDTFWRYVAMETQWIEDDQLLHMGVASGGGYKANWFAFMAAFENIGNMMPGANGVIRNLKDPVLDA